MYSIKKLKPAQKNIILEHLLRLDAQSKYDRFCVAANDGFIERYVEQLNVKTNGIYGIFDDELNMIGLGECIFYSDKKQAEVAFSIEIKHQGKGLGNKLMKKLIQFAHSNSVNKLQMYCLRTNIKSLHLAKKYGLNLTHQSSEVQALIEMPQTPSWIHQNYEIIDDVIANFEIVQKKNSILWKLPYKGIKIIRDTFFKTN